MSQPVQQSKADALADPPYIGRSPAVLPIAARLLARNLVGARYQLRPLIGTGKFTSVHEAEDVFLMKRFALKIFKRLASDSRVEETFRANALASKELEHPNLVKVTDFGFTDDGHPFLVTERLYGQTLADYLINMGPLDNRLAVQLFIPICRGLAHAHKQGVVYGNITAANIFLERDSADDPVCRPKIDVGRGKEVTSLFFSEKRSCKTDDVVPAWYAQLKRVPAPVDISQFEGEQIDEQSDIYAFGCVLFQTLTNFRPFAGISLVEAMLRRKKGRIPSLKEAMIGADYPLALDQMLRRMLAADRRERYGDFEEIEADLVLFNEGKMDKISACARGYRIRSLAKSFNRLFSELLR